ncbi:MAG: Na+/solute symporter [Candidatus Micrarchaeum acidiphilum ARMAN-2]|uniref:Na+/solute symporter n=1 Tax=Candidatus Micrarchaeum acidiphilum ARMAN-2 TaxID=425595 RepID=C7DGQ5_MICA2|nr:MAG: Na+/solute symporter [Candidatus Micrarchaeum acidiphilum ARMAN-2]
MIDDSTYAVFIALFVIFIAIGFLGKRFRKGDLSKIEEWSLGGRNMGTALVWFLVGADLFTAYTFIAVPSSMFKIGALYYFAVPYVSITFAIAMLTMPRLWRYSKKRGYITAADFIKDKFNSRSLAVIIAVTGIVAELPYIALQVVGIQAILTSMLLGSANIAVISTVAIVLAFVALAGFTFVAGLRGVTLTAIFKDALIFITVAAVIIGVTLSLGGFGSAFSKVPTFVTLPSRFAAAYISLFFMSALALYLYPHAINGSFSAKDAIKLRRSQSLLPIYAIGLAFIVLFGVLIYGVPSAMSLIKSLPPSSSGVLVVPTLIASTMPGWFVGFAFLGIFIGGLVPAALMAIAIANLLTRNIIKEIKPDIGAKLETTTTKWFAVLFEFIALGFVFIVPATYAIQLQLLGGIIILQTMPAVFIALFTNKLNKYGLGVGWLVGIVSGIYLVEVANHFGLLSTSLMSSPFGLLFIGATATAINLVIVLIWSAVSPGKASPDFVKGIQGV